MELINNKCPQCGITLHPTHTVKFDYLCDIAILCYSCFYENNLIEICKIAKVEYCYKCVLIHPVYEQSFCKDIINRERHQSGSYVGNDNLNYIYVNGTWALRPDMPKKSSALRYLDTLEGD